MTSPRMQGMPWVSCNLMVRDVQKAIDFYLQAFNFKLKDTYKDDKGAIMHAELSYQDAVIMLGPEGAHTQSKSPASSGLEPAVSLYVYCEDVDHLYQHATKNGAKSHSKPEDMFWGDRLCRLQDPDGHLWGFATYMGVKN